MTTITARSNARVQRWRELVRDARARRKERRLLIEGEHLVAAWLDSGKPIEELIVSKSATFDVIAARCRRIPVVLSDAVFQSIADTATPAGVLAEISLPASAVDLRKSNGCVFLETIQDAGNVGAILRSAAAFGIRHAVLGPGCADVWSPKVLRAGMGAHFTMDILENANLADAIERFGGKIACTAARGGTALKNADLSGRIGWVFGAEGRGVSKALAALATLKVTIPMPGTAESLNVAAAAAVCFYELSRRGA